MSRKPLHSTSSSWLWLLILVPPLMPFAPDLPAKFGVVGWLMPLLLIVLLGIVVSTPEYRRIERAARAEKQRLQDKHDAEDLEMYGGS